MEKTCRCDLDWFFDQWAYGIGYPVVRFSRHWDPATRVLEVTVEQTQTIDSLHPLFRFPTTVRVITRDSLVRQNIMVTQRQETFQVPLPSEPLAFRFDEGGWLLGRVTGDQTEPELAAMAKHDLDWAGRRWALQQLADRFDSVAADARRFIVLNEHSAALRAGALRQMARDSHPTSRVVLRSALGDADNDVRAQALLTLRTLDTAAAVAAAERMYRGDPSGDVRQAALTVLAQGKGRDALPLLVAATDPAEPGGVRIHAAGLLRRFRDPQAEDALVRLTATTETRDMRQVALHALAQTGDSSRATAVALGYVNDYDPLFAVEAIQVVGQVGGAAGKARLQAALKQETRVSVRQAETRAVGGP